VQISGPVWSGPLHDPAFVADMIAEAEAGLHPHPETLPECDAGSNTRALVESSRKRMLGILKSCANEARGPLCLVSCEEAAALWHAMCQCERATVGVKLRFDLGLLL
jgi:tRNA G26 N,N-dimethylase Trm1